MTTDQRIELLTDEIGYHLTRLENHPEDGPERIGHCLGLMRLLGGSKRADDLHSQIVAMVTDGQPTTG